MLQIVMASHDDPPIFLLLKRLLFIKICELCLQAGEELVIDIAVAARDALGVLQRQLKLHNFKR